MPPSGASNPTIVNIPLTSSVESSYALPNGTLSYQLKLRGFGSLQLAFATATTDYYTIPRGCVYSESGLLTTSNLTLFFQTPDVGMTLEILHWS